MSTELHAASLREALPAPGGPVDNLRHTCAVFATQPGEEMVAVATMGVYPPDTPGTVTRWWPPTTVTGLSKSDLRQILELLDQRAEVQRGTVERLNELSNELIEWRVDAGELDVYAQEMCSDDSAHGVATVVFPSEPDGSPGPTLCPECAIRLARRSYEDDRTLSLDVLL